MSVRSAFMVLAALAAATPVAMRAQEPEVDFAQARKQFVAGQARAAAQTLVMSSLAVRQQVGRCRDMDVGSRLLDAESQLEKLATSIGNGKVTSVKVLDKALTEVDLVLARHHLELAIANMAHPRAADIPVMSQDIDRGAYHYERSITLSGGALAPDQATAVNDARELVKTIDSTNAIPAGGMLVVQALQKLVIGASTVASQP